MTDTFCPLPWNHLSTRANGDLRVCCHGSFGPDQGILLKPTGEAYNLARDGLFDARNAEGLREVRRAMLQGERHPVCKRCWDEEDAGMKSRRMAENAVWSGFTAPLAASLTAEDGSVSETFKPGFYDLRFGNLCNLKCRMCGPEDSSLWYDDHAALTSEEHFDDAGTIIPLIRNQKGRLVEPTGRYDWAQRPAFWDEMEANLEHVEYIFMVGGEPLLIQQHYDFLERCVERGRAEYITLEFITNMTNIHKRAVDLWPHFKQVKIGCSVDGVGPVNDYIRHPSRWSAVERNLTRLDALGGNVKPSIMPSIGALNIYYLDEFIKWKLQRDFQTIDPARGREIMHPHPIHGPKVWNAKILPPEAKEAVAEKLARLIPWVEDFTEGSENSEAIQKSARKIVAAYTKYMTAEDWTHLLPEFWRRTSILDGIRGESIEHSLPELYALIKHTR